MAKHKRGFQYSTPFWIPSLEKDVAGQILERYNFSSDKSVEGNNYDEDWLQGILHKFPNSLPVNELEPGLGVLISVGREMPTPAGLVDNVYVTPEGNIVLVECKLWRNPEARRKVIAQIIDYAQSISGWGYEDFDNAIKKSLDSSGRQHGQPLITQISEAVGALDDIDEPSFIDAIQKNLRMGRMLLLVVGDGIREDTESLADYLQMHAGFHFTLGLIELAIHTLPTSGFILQPRILARTLNIERAVVKIASAEIIAEPAARNSVATTQRSAAMSLTEELFFEKLERSSAQTSRELKNFLSKAVDDGIFLDVATKSASLKWESAHGDVFNLGGINLDGDLVTYSVGWVPSAIGCVQLAHEYMEHLSRLVGGEVRKTKVQAQWYVVKKDTIPVSAIELLLKPDEWLEEIRNYQKKLNSVNQLEFQTAKP